MPKRKSGLARKPRPATTGSDPRKKTLRLRQQLRGLRLLASLGPIDPAAIN